MKLHTLQYIFLFVLFVCFSSCVSSKKYKALQETKALSQKENDQKEQKIKSLLILNDSLGHILISKDSIIDSLNTKITELQSKKEKPKNYAKKSSTMSKDIEYDLKAQFIYNFAAYIEWPIIYNGTEFVIGVAGDDAAVKKIKQIIGGKKVGGKKLKIEKYDKVTNYHIVYVTASSTSSFSNLKNEARKNKTILVTDDVGLFDLGAHISFIMNGDKIRYTLNKVAIEKLGLKVSTELMRFSE